MVAADEALQQAIQVLTTSVALGNLSPPDPERIRADVLLLLPEFTDELALVRKFHEVELVILRRSRVREFYRRSMCILEHGPGQCLSFISRETVSYALRYLNCAVTSGWLAGGNVLDSCWRCRHHQELQRCRMVALRRSRRARHLETPSGSLTWNSSLSCGRTE